MFAKRRLKRGANAGRVRAAESDDDEEQDTVPAVPSRGGASKVVGVADDDDGDRGTSALFELKKDIQAAASALLSEELLHEEPGTGGALGYSLPPKVKRPVVEDELEKRASAARAERAQARSQHVTTTGEEADGEYFGLFGTDSGRKQREGVDLPSSVASWERDAVARGIGRHVPAPIDLEEPVSDGKTEEGGLDDLLRELEGQEAEAAERVELLQARQRDAQELLQRAESLTGSSGSGAPELEERVSFFDDLHSFVDSLGACWDVKHPLLRDLETAVVAVQDRTSGGLMVEREVASVCRAALSRTAPELALLFAAGGLPEDSVQTVPFRPLDPTLLERLAVPGGVALLRRELNSAMVTRGWKVPDSVHSVKWQALLGARAVLLADARPELSDPSAILESFDDWRHKYPQSYADTFASLSLSEALGFYVRLQLCAWAPLRDTSSDIVSAAASATSSASSWLEIPARPELLESWSFGAVVGSFGDSEASLLAIEGGQPESETDRALLPRVVANSVVVALERLVREAWDPFDEDHTRRLAASLSDPMVASLPAHALRRVHGAVLARLKEAVVRFPVVHDAYNVVHSLTLLSAARVAELLRGCDALSHAIPDAKEVRSAIVSRVVLPSLQRVTDAASRALGSGAIAHSTAWLRFLALTTALCGVGGTSVVNTARKLVSSLESTHPGLGLAGLFAAECGNSN
jgi:hypothetical protein